MQHIYSVLVSQGAHKCNMYESSNEELLRCMLTLARKELCTFLHNEKLLENGLICWENAVSKNLIVHASAPNMAMPTIYTWMPAKF